ncbi:unnamed protein product [Porites lobata]|uniref:Uncharacterized protein n=1 Tax=Porites lobata TaxID=104759 RepID=A0ABN8RCT3_9CNID|nr:unnamed protein product [Porites lobata]
MSVGHPGTGKSPAIETVLATLRDIDTISKETLIQNAAILIFRMDKGHGLLDRFLITVPNTRKLTPEKEEEGTHYLADLPLQDFVSLFAAIYAAH